MELEELKRRKRLLNLAIVHVEPEVFAANFLGWLEVVTWVTAMRAGEVAATTDGAIPPLSAEQLRGGNVANTGNDAMFAFCTTAALQGNKAALDKVDSVLVESLGPQYPGSFALGNFRATIEAPTTLDDFVGQAGKKMLIGDKSPPPLRAAENWSAGLRFLERARKSNFVQEIIYPLAKWHRARWTETLETGVAFLHHIEDSVPVLREVLEDPRNDEPFIANLLLRLSPAVDIELADDTQGFLRSLARRV